MTNKKTNLITVESIVKLSLFLYKIARILFKFEDKNVEKRAHFVSKSIKKLLDAQKNYLGQELRVIPVVSAPKTYKIDEDELTFESEIVICSAEDFTNMLVNSFGMGVIEAVMDLYLRPFARGESLIFGSMENKSAKILSGVFANRITDGNQLIATLIHELVHQTDYIMEFTKKNNIRLKQQKLDIIFRTTLSGSLKELYQMA
jgi:hypothetical protein